MIAGRLSERLTILKPVTVVNAFGEESTTYTEQATVHAERVKESAMRRTEVSEHFPDHDAEFNVRNAHVIEENWRVKQLGGNLYTVVAIVPNRLRGYVTLNCERVNE